MTSTKAETMIGKIFDRALALAKSPKRKDRAVAGVWFIAIAPAMAFVGPLFCVAHGLFLLFGRKPL